MKINPKTLLDALTRYPSVTPYDEGCQEFIIDFLSDLGFQCERFPNPPVDNVYAFLGEGSPTLMFAGHTDVVAPGPLDRWHTDPYRLTEQEGCLYGRGTADMKGGLACMLAAVSAFVSQHPNFKGKLAFLITSAEESDTPMLGTPHVLDALHARNEIPDYCIIGEPSCTDKIGDTIRIGRRGSLSAEVTLHGKQGHVAYPDLAQNPIHKLTPALKDILNTVWDQGNEHFPPTSLQVTHIHTDNNGHNVIPGSVTLHFNLRYSSEQTDSNIRRHIETCFSNHDLLAEINWIHNGEPFLTASGRLIDSCTTVIQGYMGITPTLSTSGGTSDGRFIAPYGIETVELGLTNGSIHQVNEHIGTHELAELTTVYTKVCEHLLLRDV